jgi:hypothetical protein
VDQVGEDEREDKVKPDQDHQEFNHGLRVNRPGWNPALQLQSGSTTAQSWSNGATADGAMIFSLIFSIG